MRRGIADRAVLLCYMAKDFRRTIIKKSTCVKEKTNVQGTKKRRKNS